MHAELAFNIESPHDLQHEIGPLMEENWATVANDFPRSRLRPNLAFYLACYDNGTLRTFTSRDGDVLVGYAIVYIVQHPHRMDDYVATVDTLFIKGSARASGHAAQFLSYIEEQLRFMGVVALTLGSRSKVYDRWLRMRGYNEAERIWERSLQWNQ